MSITLPSGLLFALFMLIGGFCWAAGAALFAGVVSLFGRKANS